MHPGAARHPLGDVFLVRGRGYDRDALERNNYVPTGSLFRRDLFPGWDVGLHRYHDWDVVLTLSDRGIIGTYVPVVLYEAHYLDAGGVTNGDGQSDQDARLALRRKHRFGGG